MPHWSCAYKSNSKAIFFFYCCLALSVLILTALFTQAAYNITLLAIEFLILSIALLRVLAIGLIPVSNSHACEHQVRNFTPIIWPKFTLLVPLHNEAQMVPSLMENLARLDYPKDKINIFIICEADDRATCTAVKKHLRAPFHIFIVQPGEPRTKPKALNLAYFSLSPAQRGDIITVYDAEDRPHPLQLKAAALALHKHPYFAAVQAPLNFYNARKSMLTAFFALEYGALFHVWNPALSLLRLPFTLGGTSNHIRRSALDAAGAWDSYNVTEDADLSFRISALHRPGKPMRIGCIGFGTQEEAVSHYQDWVNQRSRWIKGFIQSWAVHMRLHRAAPDNKIFHFKSRLLNFAALQITIGATLLAAFIHVPSLLIIGGLTLTNVLTHQNYVIPNSLLIITGISYGAALLINVAGALYAKKYFLLFYVPLLPIYWLLYFLPALIAAHEIFTAPSHWRKTNHNIRCNDTSRPLDEETDMPI